MTRRLAIAFLYCLFFSLSFTACSDEEATTKTESTELAPIVFEKATVYVELALDRQTQQRGLMFRKELAEDNGMLFVYDSPTSMSFWMRNTSIPLDIGFLTEDGILREIHKLYPFDENSVKSYSDKLLYALEVNQGWFAKNGIKTGDKIDIKKLNDFLYPKN